MARRRGGFALAIAACAVLPSIAAAGTASAEIRVGRATPTLIATAGAVDVQAPLTGVREIAIPVTLNDPAPGSVTLRYQLVAGSARAGKDFRSHRGLVTFARHALIATIPVTVLADAARPASSCWYQADTACRTFSVSLKVVSGSVAVGAAPSADAILWDAPGGQGVSVGDALVANGTTGPDRVVRVPVTLEKPASASASVAYELVAGSALTTASFAAAHGTIRFAPGATTSTVAVSVVAGHGFQPFEELYVELSHPSGVSIKRAKGTVIIATGAAGVPDPISAGYTGVSLTQVASAKTKASDSYTIAASDGTVVMSGNAPVISANDRMAYWPTAASPSADEESCASWASQDPAQATTAAQANSVVTQEGLALRFTTKDGVTRGLTVTKNVWAGADFALNVHEWNTSWPVQFQLLQAFNLNSYLVSNGAIDPLPWDICAEVVGSTLQFEVWLAGQVPPAWGNTTQGGTVQLGAGWDYQGEAGWYVGHLKTGASATYTNLLDEAPQAAPSL